MTSRHKRRRKLIKPKVQLKLVGAFVGISALGFLLQYILLAKELTELALDMPEGGSVLAAQAPTLLLTVLGTSFGILFPLTVAVGIVLTFRIAGPIYRFERYLESVARGEETGPCRIRRNDAQEGHAESGDRGAEAHAECGDDPLARAVYDVCRGRVSDHSDHSSLTY